MSTNPRPAEAARALIDYANALTHLPPDDLPDLVDDTCRRLGAAGATIYIVDLVQRQLTALGIGGETLPVEGTVAGRAYRSAEIVPQAIEDGVRLWVPLMDSAERLGALAIDMEPLEGDLSDHVRELWSGVGSLVGEGVRAKSDYGDSIKIARGMHRTALAAELRWALLPPLTFTSPRVEVSGILEPAFDIAGDTFDYAVNGDEIHVGILDAMGHGLEASRMANLAVGAYRHARRRHCAVEEMLEQIDTVIESEFGEQRFVTGQLAVLDAATGRLRIVNAGHPPPLIFRDGRSIGNVECEPCPPLGLGQVDTTEARLSLEPGDVVVLFTDGVTEARSAADDEFGENRLADLVSRSLRAQVVPAEVLRRVVEAIYHHTGPTLEDDATLVLLRWKGPTDPGERAAGSARVDKDDDAV